MNRMYDADLCRLGRYSTEIGAGISWAVAQPSFAPEPIHAI